MACGEYEQRVEIWQRAVVQENFAYNPDSRQVTSASILIESRHSTTADRLNSEYSIDLHIKACKQCAVEGNKPMKAPPAHQ